MSSKETQPEPTPPNGISEEELQKKTAFELLQHANGSSDFLDKISALYFFNFALQKAPNIPDIYSDRALMQHYRFADIPESFKDHSLALEKDPYFFPSLFAKATLYFSIEEYSLALETYIKALDSSTDNFFSQTIHIQIANIYEKLGDYVAVEEEYKKAIECAPSFGGVYLKRALMYYSLTDYGKALLDCNTSLFYNSKCSNTLLLRSYIFTLLGEYSLALQDIQSLISSKYYSDKAYTWYSTLTNTLDILQEYEEAYEENSVDLDLFQEYTHALTILLSPTQIFSLLEKDSFLKENRDSYLFYSLAETFYSLHAYKEALFYIEKSLSLEHNKIPFLFFRASLYFALQEYLLAIEDILLIFTMYDESISYFNLYSLLAENYIALGEEEYALQCYNTLLNFNKEDSITRKKRALFYYSLNRFQSAITDFEYLLQQKEKDKSLYKYLGFAQMSLQWFRAAAQSFTSYLEYSTTEHIVFYYRSICYLNRDKALLALEDITKALYFTPHSLEYLQHKIAVHLALQQYSFALEHAFIYKEIALQNNDEEHTAHSNELIIYLQNML